MKMKHLLVAAAPSIGALLCFVPPAQAADGTIEFTGNITAATCTVVSGSGGVVQVQLPAVATSALKEVGATAGQTPFTISLTGCPTDGDGTVGVAFEGGNTVNADTGRLILDAGGARNVEVGLLNDRQGKIVIGAADQNSQRVPVGADGKVDLRYFAQYEATGGAEAGAANTRVQYSITYE